MEFSEVREYQPGDEVRSIDWNVTARMRRPYVKRYIEERELTVMLAVDVSGSERFGTRRRFKSEVASELAAVLAMSNADAEAKPHKRLHATRHHQITMKMPEQPVMVSRMGGEAIEQVRADVQPAPSRAGRRTTRRAMASDAIV